MMRLVRLGVVLGALVATAHAQAPPSNCSFPQPKDTLTSIPFRDLIKSELHNKWQCILNRLQDRALQTPRSEVICHPVSLSPLTRQQVTLTASAILSAADGIVPIPYDTSSPPMITAEVEPSIGTAVVKVWAWNHSEDARVALICAHIVRP